MHKLKGRLGVLLAALSAMMLMSAVWAQSSFAALKVEAKDFTEPVEDGLSENLPTVVAFIAAVFTVTMVIQWIRRRAKESKS